MFVRSWRRQALVSAAAALNLLALTPVWAQQLAAMPIQVPTVDQLAQFPRMTGFRLSPDGKHMLAIESQGDVRTVLVWKSDQLSVKPTAIGATSMRISGAMFLKNDMLAVTMEQPLDVRIGGELRKTFIQK